ncbi:TonB-dependent receptor plug domain-containing protein [Marinobacter xestospongiae]|uniref:TonB-dependent receptor n=1 Tax=Marinobacter xestospongiae TaxID=994319 RepID=A0ABU3W2U5_9GAMM|nr:TonB-dependent receptor [Marinobacter xestospongiae]MDV2080660.1 TonB-dependent receptor [Marinobacter xestospongiae]
MPSYVIPLSLRVPASLPLVVAASLSLLPASAFSSDMGDSLWDISLEELGQIRVVSIASGTSTPLDKAAAVTSVIHSDDIAAMGATDLDQVLETVPGLHVNHSDQAFSPKYVFRGITSSFNPQALMLINGIPATTMMFGNRGNAWGGMPVKAIERIEVIRGPGSALYGADAYAGVINIITKHVQDIPQTVVGGRVGSFDTRGGWLESATEVGDIGLSLVLEYQTTDGWDETIDHDAQTNFDSVFGTSASLAPGPVNTGVDQIDLRFEAGNERWTFHMGLQDRSNVGTGPGIAQALDPEGQYGSTRINADYSYSWIDVMDGLDLEARLSVFRISQDPETDIVLYPAGAFGGAFPDGLIGSPGYEENQARFDLSSIYNGFDHHRIQAGIGAFWADLYDVSERKNFNPDLSPKGQVEDVSDDPSQVWMPEEDRVNYYLFLQDEWQFDQNWQLVSGVRYDYYTDFGSTVNPRIALIWATTDSLTTKLLYGRAFRAPSLNELYVANNPVTVGNPDLDPETIDTLELAFSHQLTSSVSYGANLFYYRIDDLITSMAQVGQVSAKYANVGEREGYGVEMETLYEPRPDLTLAANYAYQRATDQDTDEPVGEAPNHQLYGRIQWRFVPDWQLSSQVNWVGEQKRVAGDSRKPVDDAATWDLSLRGADLGLAGLDASLTVRNLLDENVRDPSPFASPVPSIPNDFPMAGRSVVGELQYRF